MTLLVNEIFETIQGEGTYTGTPAVFVRLQGCAVGCPWCDTKHTWEQDHASRITPSDVWLKKGDSRFYAPMLESEIAAGIRSRFQARHIVITGGEPCAQNIEPLTALLIEMEWKVQIETSGTYEVVVHQGTWVTLAPKVGMPGGFDLKEQPLIVADEIKMPVGSVRDIVNLEKIIARMLFSRYPPEVYLQPLSQSPKATELCIRAATEHGWRVSLQAHKYLGLR
jgi:7-carboxy-7-deazaguanine synthase